ncbi:SIR2 family protein [Nocardioides sp.]|uniref:SIR2 family protein n=1 Tax=Nocardioides sp. TaxID=35761 RepID=UPI002611B4C0|nr:SIR2 family protein [Nocardioides sp.]
MLMFVFGAGASFDSDPLRRPGYPEEEYLYGDSRPPLAKELFTPPSIDGQNIVAEFPRAAPIIMDLRKAVARGEDVEEVLEKISASANSYPARSAQLLAFRGYLARLLTQIPSDWAEQCQGLTNYVQALSAVDRWNAEGQHPEGRHPISCVSFNYDLLLEQAVDRAFGHPINDLADFTSSNDIHIYKPHGSVLWRQAARWSLNHQELLIGEAGWHQAIKEAHTLEWLEEWQQTDPPVDDDGFDYQDPEDLTKVWLPALSIPVRRKSVFTMPPDHREALTDDLGKVTTMVAIGWRARERHFLQLLQDHMPSQPARLVAVAENESAARETVDNLWPTGRFQAYAVSTIGFSGFADGPSDDDLLDDENLPSLTLAALLEDYGVRWIRRQPGSGLPHEAESPYFAPNYADL